MINFGSKLIQITEKKASSFFLKLTDRVFQKVSELAFGVPLFLLPPRASGPIYLLPTWLPYPICFIP